MIAIFGSIDLLLLHILVITTTAFPILYAARSDWRQTNAGKSVMVSTTALALLVDVSVIGHYIKHVTPLVSVLVSFGVFCLILIGSIYKLGALLSAQHLSRVEQKQRECLRHAVACSTQPTTESTSIMAGLTADHINQVRAAAGASGSIILPAATIADLFNSAMRQHGGGQFNNKARVAALLSECLMESAYFRTTVEYADTGRYQPWRGRTFIQLTWKSNYKKFGKWCVAHGLLAKGQANYFVKNPVALGHGQWAALGGVFYFTTKKWGRKTLCQIADGGSSLQIGRAVNLGNPYSKYTPNGQSERDRAYRLAMRLPDSIVPTPAAPPKPTKKPTTKNVKTINVIRRSKARIHGYASPSLSARVVRTVPKGYSLRCKTRCQDSTGRWWVQGTKGVWWVRSSTALVKTIKPSKPKPAHTYYVTKPGDSLSKIAAQFHTTVKKLQTLNNIKNPDVIGTNVRLIVK